MIWILVHVYSGVNGGAFFCVLCSAIVIIIMIVVVK